MREAVRALRVDRAPPENHHPWAERVLANPASRNRRERGPERARRDRASMGSGPRAFGCAKPVELSASVALRRRTTVQGQRVCWPIRRAEIGASVVPRERAVIAHRWARGRARSDARSRLGPPRRSRSRPSLVACAPRLASAPPIGRRHQARDHRALSRRVRAPRVRPREHDRRSGRPKVLPRRTTTHGQGVCSPRRPAGLRGRPERGPERARCDRASMGSAPRASDARSGAGPPRRRCDRALAQSVRDADRKQKAHLATNYLTGLREHRHPSSGGVGYRRRERDVPRARERLECERVACGSRRVCAR
jgi:hypothetical protein